VRTETIIFDLKSNDELSKHSSTFVSLIISKIDDTYCSLCPELNIALEADSFSEIIEFSKEAIKDYLEECIKSGIKISRHSSIELIEEYKNNEIETIKILITKNLLEYA